MYRVMAGVPLDPVVEMEEDAKEQGKIICMWRYPNNLCAVAFCVYNPSFKYTFWIWEPENKMIGTETEYRPELFYPPEGARFESLCILFQQTLATTMQDAPSFGVRGRGRSSASSDSSTVTTSSQSKSSRRLLFNENEEAIGSLERKMDMIDSPKHREGPPPPSWWDTIGDDLIMDSPPPSSPKKSFQPIPVPTPWMEKIFKNMKDSQYLDRSDDRIIGENRPHAQTDNQIQIWETKKEQRLEPPSNQRMKRSQSPIHHETPIWSKTTTTTIEEKGGHSETNRNIMNSSAMLFRVPAGYKRRFTEEY
jgi:hypothetical protein